MPAYWHAPPTFRRSRASGLAPWSCRAGCCGYGASPHHRPLAVRAGLRLIGAALRTAGAGFGHVTRTRMYLTDARHWQDVARAHGEVFGGIRPAATAVIVAGLLDPAWLVEIEAEAARPS
ncbi:MAG TPA: Rid family hydrolase [Streptosporangiaceae bacterium]|nr:Rid family hydrolase [Streptosporangiaceae bacterium]